METPGGVGRGRGSEPRGIGGNVRGLGVDKLRGCLNKIRPLNFA